MVSRRVAGLETSARFQTGTKARARFALPLAVALFATAGACGHSKPAGGTGAAGGGAAGGAHGGAGGGAGAGAMAGASGTTQKLTILHTGDIHDHLMGHSPETDYTPATLNDDLTKGGMARLATAIKTAKIAAATAGTPTLLLDAGDFSMGSLFELLSTHEAPTLQFMKALGYDAITLGNHEFDWTPTGLAAILGTATLKGVDIPIVASNMKFSATDPGDDQLQMLATGGIIKTKFVKTVGSLKVGFFGLLGADAVTVTPQAAPLTFDPIATAAVAAVTELRTVDKVDLVIALSHSGISSAGKGEDADLAAALPAMLPAGVAGIDIIVSGHTHDFLKMPVQVGKTWIVAAGAYTTYLGDMQLSVTPSATLGGQATVTVDDYNLMPIDDAILGDATTQAAIDAYIAGLDATLMPATGLTYKKVVATTTVDLPLPAYAEAPIGNLVTDAYRTIVGALQPTEPPQISVEANGQLRSALLKGKTGQIWFEDLFRVTPIGIGPDMNPGFPMVTFYLNAADIKAGLELGAAPEVASDEYFLQVSGLKVTYDSTKPVFNRVVGLSLASPTPGGPDTALVLTDTTKCYKVTSSALVAGLLGVVKSFTHNLLSVTAKAKDCATPIDPTQAASFVDADPVTAGVQELKHWQAVVKYVSMLPDTNADTIPDVPAAYGAAQGRIVKQ